MAEEERHWGSRWPLTATFATATTITTTAGANIQIPLLLLLLLLLLQVVPHLPMLPPTFPCLSCSLPVCYLLPSITLFYAVNAPGLTVLVLSPP